MWCSGSLSSNEVMSGRAKRDDRKMFAAVDTVDDELELGATLTADGGRDAGSELPRSGVVRPGHFPPRPHSS